MWALKHAVTNRLRFGTEIAYQDLQHSEECYWKKLMNKRIHLDLACSKYFFNKCIECKLMRGL